MSKKVLIVSALQVFPPLSGGNRRTAIIAEAFADAGLQVRVFSLTGRKADIMRARPSETVSIRPGIEEHVSRRTLLWMIAMVFYRLGWPPFWAQWTFRLFGQLRFHRIWSQWKSEADVLMLDFPFVVGAADGFDGRVILNTHNVEQNLSWGRGLIGQWWRRAVARLESQAARRADVLACSSDEEVAFLCAEAPGKVVILVPNCVDGSRFADRESLRAGTRRELGLSDGQRVLLFAASIYGPNRHGFEFLRDLAIRHESALTAANVVILVAGSVSRVPERTSCLIVTGPVAKIESYFAAADWGLNPIFEGSGTSVKVAEMMAAGLPLLTTRVGIRGFDLEPGQDALFFERDDLLDVLSRLPAEVSGMVQNARIKNLRFMDSRAAVAPLVREIRR